MPHTLATFVLDAPRGTNRVAGHTVTQEVVKIDLDSAVEDGWEVDLTEGGLAYVASVDSAIPLQPLQANHVLYLNDDARHQPLCNKLKRLGITCVFVAAKVSV